MRYLLLLLPLMLLGCADSSTTGSIRNYDIRVDIAGNNGPVSLTFPLNVDSASNTDQTTENASDIAPDIRLQLTEGGGTGAMSGADAVLKDITSTLSERLKSKAVDEAIEELDAEVAPTPDPAPARDEPAAETGDLTKEDGSYHGRHNGDRPTWYFSKDFAEYPSVFILSVTGCLADELIEHDGKRYERSDIILKQSDVSGRGMALVMPASCQGTQAFIEY